MPRIVRASLPLAAALLAAACGRPAEPLAAAPAVTVHNEAAGVQHLRRHIDQTPRTLDPSLSTDISAGRVIDDLFEGLVRPDASGNVVPGVARAWQVSPDGLRYTFELRPEARWSDGRPVTAADFVFAWRRTVDPRTAAEYAQALAPIANAADIAGGVKPVESLGVRAEGSGRLVVELAAPTSYFLWLLTNPFLHPQPEHVVSAAAERWTRPGVLVGNGAFRLRSQLIGGSIELERNPHYWDAAAVRLERVTYFPLGDRVAATARYLAGDLDVTDSISPDDTQRMKAQLGPQVVISPSFATLMFGLQLRRAPFDARALRQALNMALDREILARYVLREVVVPAYNAVPPLPGYPAMRPAWADLPDAERHALARRRYAEAGYSAQRPLRVELSYPTSSTDVRRLIEAMAAMWRMNLGADVRIANQEWKVLQQERRLGKPAFYWWSWFGDFPDPLTFLALFRAGNSQNFGGYASTGFDRLLDEGTGRSVEHGRFESFAAAERILNEDAPFLPVYFYTHRKLVKPYVRGFEPNVMDRHLSREMHLLAHVQE